MKIAIVGSGISGLTAAWRLDPEHDVTVYEANAYVGGHTATVDTRYQGRDWAIDTGFIVYNDWTYPNFIALLAELGVANLETEMGFSVTTPDRRLEYGGSSLNALFSDRRNLFNPRFLGMIRDILRFNRQAVRALDEETVSPDLKLTDFLEQQGYGRWFTDFYLVPMASAIWSAAGQTVRDFQALFLLRFFRNHGLLSVDDRPQWRVVRNGSRSYVDALLKKLRQPLRVNAAVQEVQRQEASVTVVTADGAEDYDQVVMATHSDQALKLLAHPSAEEQEILRAIPYSDNSVILHHDESLLPASRRAWSSWNYMLGDEDSLPVLTYNMNILQSLEAPVEFCVTVNGEDLIDESKVLGRYRYAHPQFSSESVSAQQRWAEISGVNRTWYCGAYWSNGFHEDGVVSGMRVADGIGDLQQ